MASVNRVVLIGNLGKDVELKYTDRGKTVARFSLATSDRFKGANGDWSERTEWHNIVLFDRTAEIAGEYLSKGRQVYIEGSIRTNSWDDKETGQKKYRTEIIGNQMVLLGSGEGRERPRAAAASTPSHDSTEITDEDIPF